MSVAKKMKPIVEDQVNARIQSKFDQVYEEQSSENTHLPSEGPKNELGSPFNFDTDEMIMERNEGNNKKSSEKPNLNFDAADEDEIPLLPENSKRPTLSLDQEFKLEEAEFSGKKSALEAPRHEGFIIDDSDIGDIYTNKDVTQKTILSTTMMLNKSDLTSDKISADKISADKISADKISAEEEKANIESTIKDIIRPNLEVSVDRDLDSDEGNLTRGLSKSESSLNLSINETDSGLDFDIPHSASSASTDATMEFDLNSLSSEEEIVYTSPTNSAPPVTPVEKNQYRPADIEPPSIPNSEDSMRYLATIRALREEREEMLLQIKNLKGDSKELEQDNLTLKANLDEAKIEITILRKRHMVEIEDHKYRMNLSEEKKAMAEEKAKQADIRREKLEHKVRIDFNQVKQREKELESKLELLSMDIDSQVQSRDHKILELRRKIDALEFNMENASIKEQKSLDDKRKLEDRLNKIMKTLRHSIKNLEDDIDQAQDGVDFQKDKN